MGYRSDIYVVLTKFDYDDLVQKAKEVKNFDNKYLLSILTNKVQERNGYVLFSASWVKWYDFDNTIKFIDGFLDGHRHVFVRFGEDYCDIECEVTAEDEKGSDDELYDVLRIKRQITSNIFDCDE